MVAGDDMSQHLSDKLKVNVKIEVSKCIPQCLLLYNLMTVRLRYSLI